MMYLFGFSVLINFFFSGSAQQKKNNNENEKKYTLSVHTWLKSRLIKKIIMQAYTVFDKK